MGMKGRLALITGASAGLGAAFAEAYARRGCSLLLTARRLDRLEAAAAQLRSRHGVEVACIRADLSVPMALETALAERGPGAPDIDILVNNAGYGLPGGWVDSSWQDQAAALEVMLTAPMRLSHALLPGMRRRRFGRILNISSLAGLVPGGPGHTSYAAIKAALLRFSQSLSAECAGQGVHVTAVCPGLTLTEFHDVNGARQSLSRLPRWVWQTADEVAEQAVGASERGRCVVVTGRVNQAAAALIRLLPENAAHAAAVAVLRGSGARGRQ
jgi:hypothetical protein